MTNAGDDVARRIVDQSVLCSRHVHLLQLLRIALYT